MDGWVRGLTSILYKEVPNTYRNWHSNEVMCTYGRGWNSCSMWDTVAWPVADPLIHNPKCRDDIWLLVLHLKSSWLFLDYNSLYFCIKGVFKYGRFYRNFAISETLWSRKYIVIECNFSKLHQILLQIIEIRFLQNKLSATWNEFDKQGKGKNCNRKHQNNC